MKHDVERSQISKTSSFAGTRFSVGLRLGVAEAHQLQAVLGLPDSLVLTQHTMCGSSSSSMSVDQEPLKAANMVGKECAAAVMEMVIARTVGNLVADTAIERGVTAPNNDGKEVHVDATLRVDGGWERLSQWNTRVIETAVVVLSVAPGTLAFRINYAQLLQDEAAAREAVRQGQSFVLSLREEGGFEETHRYERTANELMKSQGEILVEGFSLKGLDY